MNVLNASSAAEYAGWFRCLSDATRVQILSVVARAEQPLTVGQVVDAVGKSQSTVSRHLQVLAADGFVICTPDGVRTFVHANTSCMTALPRAAAEIMGVAT